MPRSSPTQSETHKPMSQKQKVKYEQRRCQQTKPGTFGSYIGPRHSVTIDPKAVVNLLSKLINLVPSCRLHRQPAPVCHGQTKHWQQRARQKRKYPNGMPDPCASTPRHQGTAPGNGRYEKYLQDAI